jgi:predicted MPP superfamily phosphohydrolase
MFLDSAPLWLQGLFVAAVSVGAGASVFVFSLNRQLSYVEFLHKRVLLGGVLAILVGSALAGLCTALGWLTGPWLKAYLLLPGSILTILLFGEVRLVAQRFYYQAPRPVHRETHVFAGGKLVPVEERNSPYKRWHPIKTTDLAVAHYRVDVPGVSLPPSSQGETLKVVQLSDFHYSPRLPFGYFRAAVERAMLEEPDLVLLTGDFVTFSEDASRLPELFTGLRGRLGTFATLGNHDYWAGSQPVVEALRQAGIPLITNDCVRLPLWEGASLRLCGIDDPWGKPAWEPVQLHPGDLNLIISHSADNIYRLRQYPFTGVFSGHFHAGQVRIPGFGALVLPSRFGRRFDHGHFMFMNSRAAGHTHLFVSAGVGSATPLLRIYCQPDIFVVNFQVAPQSHLG